MDLASIRVGNSVGMVITTAGNDLVHTLGTNRSNVRRSAIIRKILAYNNTGGNVTLQFGTLNGTPAFVQYLPTLLALNGLDNEWNEQDLPIVEFSVLNTVPLVAANDRVGNIFVVAAVAGVLVSLEIEEFGT